MTAPTIESGVILQVYDRGPNLATWVLPRRRSVEVDLEPLLGPLAVAEDRPADPWSHIGRFGPVMVVRRTLTVTDPTGSTADWDLRKHQGFRAEVPLLLPPSDGLTLVMLVGAQGHSMFDLAMVPATGTPPPDWVEAERTILDRERQMYARASMVGPFEGTQSLIITGAIDLHSRRPEREPPPEEGRLRDLLEPLADLDFTDEEQWGRVRGALGRIIIDHCRRPPRL
ncbi:MAG: hypothetical protein SF002_03260 [Alphaproteobacteria bacterium]|nr:hypothetical protein [Alphaproteobacteria bacterium]